MARDKYKELAKEVAIRLRAAKAEWGATNPQIAEWCAASSQAVGNWLLADNLPQPKIIAVLCERKGLTLDWVYQGISPKVDRRLRMIRQLEERSELLQAETVADRIGILMTVTEAGSYREFGELCGGATVGDVKAWINSASRPSAQHMTALCLNTGVTLDWIYRGVFIEPDYDLLYRLDKRIITGNIAEPVQRAPRAKPQRQKV